MLHFAADWLPVSETFVFDLVRNLRRPPVVVAVNPLQNLDRFPVAHVQSLCTVDHLVHPALVRPPVVTTLLGLLAHRQRVGLVHAHHGYAIDRILGLVGRRKLPLVLSLHGHDVTGYVQQRPDAYRVARQLVSAVLVPSRFLLEFAVDAGFDRRVLRVMPSGVDTEFFRPSPLPEGPPTALFVGRFVEKKGLDVLARAWPTVQRALPSARLRLLGFGPLEHLARSIPGQVSVDIAPTSVGVRDAMAASRVVVTPSHLAPDDAAESLLVVNLEAQASGRAVVTTRHGGIPEYVLADETALLVPEADPPSLADALVRVLRDDDLAARLGRAGPAWARRFDLRETAAAVDAVYDELLGASAGSGRATGRTTWAGTPEAR